MTISTLCLLRVRGPVPGLAQLGRVEALEDALLVHTPLAFEHDPDVLALSVRTALGEELARQHTDARGLFLIPSIAAPKSRSYDAVVDEVGEGGVWAAWQAPQATPDLSGMLGQMMGNMPDALRAAASQLRADPDALKHAAAQLPGLLQNPGELQQLMQGVQSQLPELTQMLSGMGIDLSSPQLQQMSRDLESQLQRDPQQLAKLAESLFAAGAGDEAEDDEDEEVSPPKRK